MYIFFVLNVPANFKQFQLPVLLWPIIELLALFNKAVNGFQGQVWGREGERKKNIPVNMLGVGRGRVWLGKNKFCVFCNGSIPKCRGFMVMFLNEKENNKFEQQIVLGMQNPVSEFVESEFESIENPWNLSPNPNYCLEVRTNHSLN